MALISPQGWFQHGAERSLQLVEVMWPCYLTDFHPFSPKPHRVTQFAAISESQTSDRTVTYLQETAAAAAHRSHHVLYTGELLGRNWYRSLSYSVFSSIYLQKSWNLLLTGNWQTGLKIIIIFLIILVILIIAIISYDLCCQFALNSFLTGNTDVLIYLLATLGS